MPGELDLRAPDMPGYRALAEILGSVVEALGAGGAALALLKGESGTLCQGPSCGLSLSPKQGLAVASWVVDHEEPLALVSPEQALETLGLVVGPAELFPLFCVPLRRDGQILGALQLIIPSWADVEEPQQRLCFLKVAAASIGCALENERLQEELQKKEAYVMRLVKASIEAQEAEREKICLEVHDGVTQTLVSAFQYLQALETTLPPQEEQAKHMVTRAAALVRQAVQEAREVINSLTPDLLRHLGLERTLREELRQFEKETGCLVEFEAHWPRLPQDTEMSLYRIIHEAVTNVRRHAKSPSVRVALSCQPGHLAALIKDRGVGFDPSQQGLMPTRRSAGLFSMHKRAELLGGTCRVESAPGKGTEVWVKVPVME
ncbi:MAG: GAF domain-containing sensor histidine kinase [Chloroflexota bacterium]|nr:GAF domain-containing sensor histidine kinase [Chloroflexota bacterium]